MEKIATIKKKWFIDQVDLLNKAGMTKTEIASRLNIKPQSLNNVLSRDQSVSDNLLDKFIAVFDVRDFDLPPSKASEQSLGIPLLPYEAVAGYGVMNYTDLRAEDFYVVSELRGADFLLRIKGDSMTPKFNGGDIVACRKIELSQLRWQFHRIYAIYTNSQGVLIKRIEAGEEPDCVTCVSENPAYPPFQVPVEDIASVALVIGAIVLE